MALTRYAPRHMVGLFLVTLVLAALSALCLRIAHADEPRRPGPIGLIALIGATAAITLALTGFTRDFVSPATTSLLPGTIAGLTVSIPLAFALLWIAIDLFRSPEVEPHDAWPWVTASILTALLAAANRIRFIDSQLLLLAGVALFWWRSTRAAAASQSRTGPPLRVLAAVAAALLALSTGIAATTHHGIEVSIPALVAASLIVCIITGWNMLDVRRPVPDPLQSLPTGRIGQPAVATLLSLTLGLGAAAFACIVRMIRHELGHNAGGLSAFDTLLVIADSLRSAPYLPGLRVLADDAWIAGAAAVAILWMSALPPRFARITNRVIAGAFAVAAAFLLFRGPHSWHLAP